MPPLSVPPELKPITPFIRRAEELDKDSSRPESRLVAYYCRQHAVHTGIPLASTSPSAKTTLGQLLEVLEREKAAMDNFTRPEAEYLCRQFAYGVFDKADGQDRAGTANKSTAKTFYTSASFLQMLVQFHDPENEESNEHHAEDKKRALYAKWKATEILKAIKEGRTPKAGGYGEEEMPMEEEEQEDADGAEKKQDDIPPPPVAPPPVAPPRVDEEDAPHDEQSSSPSPPPPAVPPPVAPPPPVVETVFKEDDDDDEEVEEEGTEVPLGPPPPYIGSSEDLPPPPPTPPPVAPAPVAPPPAAPAPVAPPPKKSGWFGGKAAGKTATKAQIADATELTKFALSALEDKDAELAAERLQQALEALGRSTKLKRSAKQPNKTQMADATELVRFAQSSLEGDKDATAGAQRLQQALKAMGRV